MSCYVYVLRKPDGEAFYVGKGSGQRAYKHVFEAAHGIDYNPFKNRVIRKLAANGQEPIVEIVREFDNDNDAYRFEAELIEQIGRRNLGAGPLTNITAGGEGVVGYPQTPAIREAKRQGALARYRNPEELQRQTEHMRRIAADPEISKKTRLAVVAARRRPEARALASEIAKERWSDAEARERMHSAQVAYCASEEGRAQIRARHQRMLAGGFRPNTKAVIVDGIRYSTIKAAAEAIGLDRKTLNARFRRYAKKGEFPEGWGYLDTKE